MKYYYIKYWETVGIEEIDTDAEPSKGGIVYVTGGKYCHYGFFLHIGGDAFVDKEAARSKIAVLLQRRIASVEAKLEKLRSMVKEYPAVAEPLAKRRSKKPKR